MDLNEQIKEMEKRYPSVDIYSPPGTKVVFNGTGGYRNELENAKQYLTIGETYTLAGSNIGGFSSTFYLEEFPNKPFNSVHFSPEGWEDEYV